MKKKTIVQMYLSWVNDFLTVPRFMEYYGLPSEVRARRIINVGRSRYNQSIARAKV